MKYFKKVQPTVFSLSKIKTIIQSNEKIGKISCHIPSMTNKILEMFLVDAFSEMIILLKRKKGKKIKVKHFNYIIKKFRRFKKHEKFFN
mmetsp:Transcript_13165/g.25991  ORF Transcript_13165/g.25991 Transcript_13165/m.25991 type:complete len:89 (+) Transcript_13165:124-390(+)